jgi:hypothetical protein
MVYLSEGVQKVSVTLATLALCDGDRCANRCAM